MNQPFSGHVHELRRRLMWPALVVLIGAAVAYFWHEQLLSWLEAPLGQTLYYSKVTGAFEFIMQACLIAGALLAAPLILYQLIAFVRPALPRPITNRRVGWFIVLASVLIVCGVVFGYYISLPATLSFLGTIDTAHLHPLIAADSYLTFVMAYLAVFGLVFLMPLIVSFIDHITPLPPAKLVKGRKWVIVGAFGAALILPIAPDPVSQIFLAIPVVIMYEVSIWVVRAHAWRRAHTTAKPVVGRKPGSTAFTSAPLAAPARTAARSPHLLASGRPMAKPRPEPVRPPRVAPLGAHVIDLRGR